MLKETQIIKAAVLGTEAYNNGKGSAPCLNQELMNMLKGRSIGETPEGEASSTNIMQVYSDSWHAANLAN